MTFEELVRKHESALIGYANRFMRDPEAARDLVQDVFLKALEASIDPSDPRTPTWLYTVLRNRAIDVKRRNSRVDHPVDIEAMPDKAPGTERDVLVQQLLDRIAQFPPRPARVLKLRFCEGMSYRQIADELGMTVSNVGVIIHKYQGQLKALAA